MKVEALAVTKEINQNENFDAKQFNYESTLLSGKMAGICYMPDNYFDVGIQNEKSALAKAQFTANNGHHSVYDHSHITLELTDIPKIVVMILNSINVYATSEKSGRYTIMHPETDLELEMYNKWGKLIETMISETYQKLDEKTVKKLALENARYMISVFTPTSLSYTISYRTLCYIVDYLELLSKDLSNSAGSFNIKLKSYVDELKDKLSQYIPDRIVFNNKNEYFRFLPIQHGISKQIATENYGDTYTAIYKASFVEIAQCQRHRTLRVKMLFDGLDDSKKYFYVPEIVEKCGYHDEWLDDIRSIAYCHPNGLMGTVIEQGLFEDFVLKCKERMCGRAQLEIMKQTEKLVRKFLENRDNLSEYNQSLLDTITPNGEPCAKCNFTTCKEPCFWGGKSALGRLI